MTVTSMRETIAFLILVAGVLAAGLALRKMRQRERVQAEWRAWARAQREREERC